MAIATGVGFAELSLPQDQRVRITVTLTARDRTVLVERAVDVTPRLETPFGQECGGATVAGVLIAADGAYVKIARETRRWPLAQSPS